MAQMSLLERRFTNVRRAIDHMAQVCQSEDDVPQELRECVEQMTQRADQAQQVIQSQDEMRILECVDDLEQMSDRAERVVQRAGSIDDEMRSAVMEAHNELSSMKHQLH